MYWNKGEGICCAFGHNDDDGAEACYDRLCAAGQKPAILLEETFSPGKPGEKVWGQPSKAFGLCYAKGHHTAEEAVECALIYRKTIPVVGGWGSFPPLRVVSLKEADRYPLFLS